jgi:hypothetical protein
VDSLGQDKDNRHFFTEEIALYGPWLYASARDLHGRGRLYIVDISEYINQPPAADAGPPISIWSQDQKDTVIKGTAYDPDGDLMTYRWLEGEHEITGWNSVEADGSAYLDLSKTPYLPVGLHRLTLEVHDGQTACMDDFILSIENSPPRLTPSGDGIYEIYAPLALGGKISDFDGDRVSYQWLEGDRLLFAGVQETVFGGKPVELPQQVVSDLSLGGHTLTLKVDDGVNTPIQTEIRVVIRDTTEPILSPVCSRTILWPPNHKMVDIQIEANAHDNSGRPVQISATVDSNEPADESGLRGDSLDWTPPVIDLQKGLIKLRLRAERSGSGSSRVYTIRITATDESDNAAQAQVEIRVPHDRASKKN